MSRYSQNARTLQPTRRSRTPLMRTSVLKDFRGALDPGILCTNCYQCVEASQVDQHSSECCKPMLVENEQAEIQQRILNLKFSISEIIKKRHCSRTVLLVQLQGICEIATVSGLTSKLLLKVNEISALSDEMPGEYTCYVYARRLAVLLEARKHSNFGDAGSLIAKVLNSSYEGLKSVRDSSQNPLPATDSSCVEEDRETEFYSMCISRKLALADTHPGKTVKINDLYREITARGLGKDDWTTYIDSVYN